MIIKKYIQFIKESNEHKYGCVMIEVPVSNWDEITSSIDTDDIYNDDDSDEPRGIQSNPHLTILYGAHDNVTLEQVKSIFDNFNGDINIEIDGIGIFDTNDKFDVVKFNVKSNVVLQELHDRLLELPNSDKFTDYKPHITIGYVKKGTGKKYLKPEYKHEINNVNQITYSSASGEKFHFDI